MSFEEQAKGTVATLEETIKSLRKKVADYSEEKLGDLRDEWEQHCECCPEKDSAGDDYDEAESELMEDPKYKELNAELELAEGELKRLQQFLKVKEPR
jgi:hypothetical protein